MYTSSSMSAASALPSHHLLWQPVQTVQMALDEIILPQPLSDFLHSCAPVRHSRGTTRVTQLLKQRSCRILRRLGRNFTEDVILTIEPCSRVRATPSVIAHNTDYS